MVQVQKWAEAGTQLLEEQEAQGQRCREGDKAAVGVGTVMEMGILEEQVQEVVQQGGER